MPNFYVDASHDSAKVQAVTSYRHRRIQGAQQMGVYLLAVAIYGHLEQKGWMERAGIC